MNYWRKHVMHATKMRRRKRELEFSIAGWESARVRPKGPVGWELQFKINAAKAELRRLVC